jgi:hypothetical protein
LVIARSADAVTPVVTLEVLLPGTGSAVVASLADWVDLDGCLLLAADPFDGLELDAEHRWILAQLPGLGLSRRAV